MPATATNRAPVPAPTPPAPVEPVATLKAWAIDLAFAGLLYWGVLTALHDPLSALLSAVSASSGPAESHLARMLSWPLTLPGLLAYGREAARPTADTALLLALFFWTSAAYHAAWEGFLRTTPGRALAGLPPLPRFNADGTGTGGIGPALWRAAARPVDGLLLGLVGGAVRLLAGGRRLGDLLAGTPSGSRLRAGSGGWDARIGPVTATVAEAKRKAGEAGERALREAFLPYAGENWRLFFNVEHPAFGDIDMLLLCPAGLFLVDAKSHRGRVGQDPATGELLRDGLPFEKDFRAQMGRQAAHVRAALSLPGGPGRAGGAVRTMLCFTRAELVGSGPERPRGAYAIAELPGLLQEASEREPALGPGEISRLAGAVSRAYGAREAA